MFSIEWMLRIAIVHRNRQTVEGRRGLSYLFPVIFDFNRHAILNWKCNFYSNSTVELFNKNIPFSVGNRLLAQCALIKRINLVNLLANDWCRCASAWLLFVARTLDIVFSLNSIYRSLIRCRVSGKSFSVSSDNNSSTIYSHETTLSCSPPLHHLPCSPANGLKSSLRRKSVVRSLVRLVNLFCIEIWTVAVSLRDRQRIEWANSRKSVSAPFHFIVIVIRLKFSVYKISSLKRSS